MLPDKKRYEDMLLALYHSMALLRSNINEFVKVLENEMKKLKEQFLIHEENE
jgi:hypothetical protein